MKKQELQALVQECLAEVLEERKKKSKGDDEFKRVDKGEKDKVAKDKGEEDVYGAGYAAGEKAAKAKYKKLAEAFQALKEARFKKGEDIGEPGKGFEKISKEAGQKVAGAILKKVLKK